MQFWNVCSLEDWVPIKWSLFATWIDLPSRCKAPCPILILDLGNEDARILREWCSVGKYLVQSSAGANHATIHVAFTGSARHAWCYFERANAKVSEGTVLLVAAVGSAVVASLLILVILDWSNRVRTVRTCTTSGIQVQTHRRNSACVAETWKRKVML